MSIEIDALRYLGIYEEPSVATYQTDHSASPGDFLALPYREGTLQAQLGRAMLDPMAGKMSLDGHSKKVLGIRSCTLNAAVTLHSHGLDLDGDVAPPTVSTWALLRVLKAIMGGTFATTNPAVQTIVVVTGTTTTAVEVTAGHGARFEKGGAIGATVAGAMEVREILSVTGDVVTVKQAFSGTPTTGTPVRGAVSVYLTENPLTSLQALIEGKEATDGAVLRGLQGGFQLQLPTGDLGQITFALTGASWARMAASSATAPSYGVFSPMVLAPLEVTCPVVGVTTRVALDQATVAIEPQIAYAPQKSGRATETIARMRRQPARPVVRGSFTIPYEDDTWYTSRDSRDDRAVFAQLGNTAGSTILISVPTVQIVDVQPAASDTAIAGQTVTFEGRNDEAISGTTEITDSALRIHFL